MNAASIGETTGIDIVIVNWNSGNQLRECIAAIDDYGGEYVSKIIVVDNGSSDGSDDVLSLYFHLNVVRTGSNLGFAKACNLGAKSGTSSFVLFLNPDAYLKPNTLPAVMDYMTSPEADDVGICGIKLVGEDDEPQRHCARFPTWRTFWGQSLGLQGRPTTLFPPFTMREFDHRSDLDVDQVIGAFFFTRRAVFAAVNGFDERFFVYYEELDLSLRVSQAGWRTRYLASPVAFHLGGGTTDQVKAKRMFYALRSRLQYAFKHFSPLAAWSVLFVTLTAEPVGRLLRAAWRKSMDEAVHSLTGYGMLLADLPQILRLALRRRKERSIRR